MCEGLAPLKDVIHKITLQPQSFVVLCFYATGRVCDWQIHWLLSKPHNVYFPASRERSWRILKKKPIILLSAIVAAPVLYSRGTDSSVRDRKGQLNFSPKANASWSIEMNWTHRSFCRHALLFRAANASSCTLLFLSNEDLQRLNDKLIAV